MFKVGLLGFGKTGSLVAKEIVLDKQFDLRWVCRRVVPESQLFASHSLGFDKSFAPFLQSSSLTSEFLSKNPVDVIIDFSSSLSTATYDLLASTATI